MNRIAFAIFAAISLTPLSAHAALKPGAKAPDFTTQAVIAGKPFIFSLAQALKKGPVVLYFYPKAFTSGCTVQAHQFSEASGEFAKAGATIIGISADDIATLGKFSVEECSNKFAVAVATPAIIKAYDASLPVVKLSNRTTYVISKAGQIVYTYSDMSANGHVAKSLEAVRALKGGK